MIIAVGVLLFFVFLVFIGNIVLAIYRHPTDHFSIRYPPSWGKVTNKDGASVIFISPKQSALDTFRENVNVVVQNLASNPMSLQKYTDTAIFQVKVVFKSGIVEVESKSIYLDGKPGYKFAYLVKGDRDIKIMHVWTIDHSRAYQVTFTALASEFDQYQDTFEKMIKSFHIQ